MLVFEVGQSRTSLGDFLGVPVPGKPSPQAKDTGLLKGTVRSMVGRMLFRRSR
ncbi:hypothetical protein [Nonomuraea aurantiaca]|uniref:hypothetical protein n=1 Tax=Nonomuraea aurantiaca TaxID=2878562 RepID=UPI003556743B